MVGVSEEGRQTRRTWHAAIGNRRKSHESKDRAMYVGHEICGGYNKHVETFFAKKQEKQEGERRLAAFNSYCVTKSDLLEAGAPDGWVLLQKHRPTCTFRGTHRLGSSVSESKIPAGRAVRLLFRSSLFLVRERAIRRKTTAMSTPSIAGGLAGGRRSYAFAFRFVRRGTACKFGVTSNHEKRCQTPH